jgi:hypothetical protein
VEDLVHARHTEILKIFLEILLHGLEDNFSLVHDGVQWQTLVKTALKFRVPLMSDNFFTS